jgi:hypothetical protein
MFHGREHPPAFARGLLHRLSCIAGSPSLKPDARTDSESATVNGQRLSGAAASAE